MVDSTVNSVNQSQLDANSTIHSRHYCKHHHHHHLLLLLCLYSESSLFIFNFVVVDGSSSLHTFTSTFASLFSFSSLLLFQNALPNTVN